MKTNARFRFAALAVILVGAVCVNAQAQRMNATIPFDFRMGSSYLPAGEYIVSSPAPGVLRFTSSDMRHLSTVIVHGVETLIPNEKAKLVFHRYGDAYFLSQVWAAGINAGKELATSATEREWAATHKEFAIAMVGAK